MLFRSNINSMKKMKTFPSTLVKQFLPTSSKLNGFSISLFTIEWHGYALSNVCR